MAHVQRRCATRSCRKAIPSGARRCAVCGGREAVWVARYRGPDHRERTKAFVRKVDAERFLAEQESRKGRGDRTDPQAGRITLERWAGDWFEGVRPALKPKTAATYESLLRSRILPDLGRIELADLRPTDVQAWVNRMNVSASRVRQAHISYR